MSIKINLTSMETIRNPETAIQVIKKIEERYKKN